MSTGSPLAPEHRMNVALASSERTSGELARALGEWLPRMLPGSDVRFWAPDADPPGEPAPDHQATCICVTPEALETPGLFYAAGASHPATPNGIAVPLILDLEPEDLADTPLTVFQGTRANRQGLLALATTLNAMATRPRRRSSPTDRDGPGHE
jgi:hypothetical protein